MTVPTEAKMPREALLGKLMQLALSTSTDEVDQAIEAALDYLSAYFECRRIMIFGTRPDGGLRRVFDWYRSASPAEGTTPSGLTSESVAPYWDRLKSGRGVALGEPDPNGRTGHNPFLPQPVYLMPMLGSGRIGGVLVFDNAQAVKEGAERDPSLLSMVSDLLLTLTQQARPQLEVKGHIGTSPLSSEIRLAAQWAMPDLMFELDSNGRLLSVISPETSHEIDASAEMVGALIEDVLPIELARDMRNYMVEIDQNDHVQCRIHKVTTAHRSMWYEVSGSHCAPRRRGEPLGYLLVMRNITERIEGEAELQKLGRIVELMTNLVAIIDTNGIITWTNKAFEEVSGRTGDSLRGQRLHSVTSGPGSSRSAYEQVLAAMLAGDGCEGEDVNYDVDGKPYWVAYNMQPLNDQQGALSGFVFIATVITKQRELEIALREERDFLSTLTETGGSGLLVVDAAGRCIFHNSEALRILDIFDPDRQARALDWPFMPVLADPENEHAIRFPSLLKTRSTVRNLMFSLETGEGRSIYSINASPLRRESSEGNVVISLTDVTDRFEADEARRKVAAKALYDANHDLLTDLANRRFFMRTLQAAMDSAQMGQVHVLAMDMDKFKRIRTVLGQDIGNDLIRSQALRIADVMGGRDRLARTESDCFVGFVVTDRPGQAAELASQLCSVIAEPCDVDGATFYLTSSIGISRMTDLSMTPETLVRQAELAIEAAKSAGGNRHAHYSVSLERRFARSIEIVQALRLALQKNQFELAFQPKFSLSGDDELVGAEALLRLHSSRLGQIRPDEFIMVAETAGMISDIDFHVMEMFARQMGDWHRRGHDIASSINLSPRSFENTTLAPRFLELLEREQVRADRVTIEITETSLVSESGAALANINRFRDGGISISVDDFGTGFSSLSYLQRLIASEIKIDRSFIAPLADGGGNPGAETILRSILALAHSFGLRTVAEGVETMEQREWLRREGCMFVQGYLGGKAVNPARFEEIYLDALTS